MTDLQLNSRKHGIDAAQFAIHPDEIYEFNQLLEGLHADMRPSGETQRLLFGQILHAAWNIRIARKHEAQSLLQYGPSANGVQSIMKFYLLNERAFYRAMTELRNLQTEFAYRATLAELENTPLPDVPPLVRTAQVHKQVRRIARESPIRQLSPQPIEALGNSAQLCTHSEQRATETPVAEVDNTTASA